MKRSVISLLLLALLAKNAFSLPNIDSVTDGGILSGNFESGILLKDHADSHIHYYSLDRLALSKDEDGVPEFSFSYTPSGALISFSVFPTTDKAALQKAKEAIKKTDSLAEFRALSLREGAYSLSFQTKSDEQVIEAGESVVTDDTANPWSVQLSLPKAEADSIVTSLVTGAVVGINFRYRFQAATSPNLVKVKIRKNALLPALKSASRQTDSSFSRLFNRLKEQKTIEVYIAGQDTSLASALWLASQYLKEKCLLPLAPKT